MVVTLYRLPILYILHGGCIEPICLGYVKYLVKCYRKNLVTYLLYSLLKDTNWMNDVVLLLMGSMMKVYVIDVL